MIVARPSIAMTTEGRTERRKFRRTANACIPCRQSKIKCSGNQPCGNCQRRMVNCRFVDSGHRIIIHQPSNSTAFEINSHASGAKRPASLAFVSDGHEDCPDVLLTPPSLVSQHFDSAPYIGVQRPAELSNPTVDGARSIWTSPFTLPSRTIKNTQRNKRNWVWLAPSSTWSFTARLTLLLAEKLELDSPYSAPNFSGEDIYVLRLKSCPPDDPPDISGLPSIDHALYLFNTVKFHLGQSYRFLDEATFVEHLQEFYHGNAAEKAAASRLWFVQFLLVLSFGNAFLSSRCKCTTEPPGSKFFIRAMALMPDHASVWKDSLLAIEVLALAGLYLYSIDHRESAHVYLGQAIRIAQLEGLHTQLPEEEIGLQTVERCRNLWWTLYIMDRHFSCSLGIPMLTRDSDITTVLDSPSACSQRDATLCLQVRLSHLLSFILTTIYKTQKTQLGTFLDQTKSILQTLAGHAREIEKIIYRKFQNSIDTMPRGTRHITLLYHQCVMVATRPLLLSVLKERLDTLTEGDEDWQTILAPTKALIATGIKSAVKTLQILSDEDSPLEVFLPYDLEFTYSAAIHLAMAQALFPLDPNEHGTRGIQNAHSILSEMASKGNRLAENRSRELVYLEGLFAELAKRIERRGLLTLSLWNSPQQQQHQQDCVTGNTAGGTGGGETLTTQAVGGKESGEPIVPGHEAGAPGGEDPFWSSPSAPTPTTSNLELLDNIGISSYEFLSIVEQIGRQEYHSILDTGAGMG
ncbi:Zn(II)2Cys6 transcription factor [Aspergillus fijiensis CBS 313.89]|uniref:Zn(II)2Cys6 transcription factor n=1 Tax=Aspergillus fijiensis CBS 313.89 TaxID=1448319 RepID=A0A8G1VXM8_9EURO|nr:Zn(II)2Cys6 transcription factor [Aspergillus fijiensis CBS 313.89]RAK73129.1 Zn(II)2Cys6 transcription factor [Aspergillus fijiensis CBS 313.89]